MRLRARAVEAKGKTRHEGRETGRGREKDGA